jgi:hypothetical protein
MMTPAELDYLLAHLGASVTIDGQEFHLAGIERGLVVFDNEDERIVRKTVQAAIYLLRVSQPASDTN